MTRWKDPTEEQVSREATKALTALSTEILKQSDEGLTYEGSFRVGAIPDRLRSEEGESLHLDGQDYWLYRKALHLLAKEKTLEHREPREVDSELWDLVCDLYIDRKSYRDQTKRKNRIDKFLRTIERPWEDFEAIFGLSDLNVTAQLVVGGVTFETITPKAARKWGLDGHDYLRRTAKELSKSAVAITQVRAGDHKKASERAKEKVDDALNLLRFGLCGAINANVWDEQMLFRRRGVWAVKALNADSRPQTNHERGFRPLGMDIGDSLSGVLTEYLSSMEGVVAGDAAQNLRQRVIRAVHWIGTSTTRETYDDKVLDLCTALETILTIKDKELKAEAIALRSMMLPATFNQGFADPGIVYYLYNDKRSDVVHGSEHRICNRQDYYRLRGLAIYMVTLYVQLLKKHPEKAKHSKIIEVIDSPDLLKQAISFLEVNPGPIANAMRSFAEERLAVRAAA